MNTASLSHTLIFQLRSHDGRAINIYSDGRVDGDVGEFCLVRNLFTPRFFAVAGIAAHLREGHAVPEDTLSAALDIFL